MKGNVSIYILETVEQNTLFVKNTFIIILPLISTQGTNIIVIISPKWQFDYLIIKL